jgi:autotransporter-associated beta strand protein
MRSPSSSNRLSSRARRSPARKLCNAIVPALTRGVMGGVLLAPAFVFAGTPIYSQTSSSATFKHHQGGTSPDKAFTFNPGSSSSMSLWTNTFGTVGVGNQYSQAFAGLGSVTNPTTTTFALKPGTGVNQNDPGHSWTASSLTLSFTGNWTANGQFGPIATGYFSMAFAGVSNGTVTARAQVSYFANGVSLRTVDSGTLTIPNTGVPTTKTWTSSKILNSGTFASGTQLKTVGTITFTADNDTALSNLYPVNFDCGNAPMTANWQSNTSGTSDWNTASNWTQDPSTIDPTGTDVVNGVPNGQGQRARFANLGVTTTGSRNVNLATNVTLGTLDVDDDDAFTFQGAGSLTFDVQQGECVIRCGNTGSGGGLTDTIDNSVVLSKTVVAQTEGTNTGRGRGIDDATNLSMNGVVSGAGGFTKVGEASCSLNASNSFGGGTQARGGYLNANATSSLGIGTVLADDGQLNYNAFHAAAPAVTSNAQNSGQINLGILPNSEHFALHDLGAISGSPAELTALSTLAGGNLTVDIGAMIAHESFDFGSGGNPVGLFNTGTASYIFGIAADFNSSGTFEVTVGSASGSIWKGFGGDRGNRLYGFDPNTATLLLNASGTTELVSLHNSLTINARLGNAGPSSINKRGGGTVVLNNVNNTYAGPITIQAGTLAVGGGLNNLTRLDVNGLTAGLNMRAGGSLSATTLTVNGGGQLVMDAGQINVGTLTNIDGQLHVNGGTLNVATFMNGNPGFIMQFSGGVANIGSFVPSTTVIVDGGRLNPTAMLATGISTLQVSDGTLTTTNASQIAGNAFFDGGVSTFGNNLTVNNFVRYNGGSLAVTGTLSMSGGSLQVAAGAQRLLKVGNVVTSAGGRVDLNDSDMVATASNYATINGLVALARNGGAWNGAGITSTAAKNNPVHATTLGVLTGSQYLSTGAATFNGHNVVASNVLVKYTYYGDTDFNGLINFDDYAHLDAGFNTGGTDWFHGDFDNNSTVNFDDYALIDLAFNVQSGSLKVATRL